MRRNGCLEILLVGLALTLGGPVDRVRGDTTGIAGGNQPINTVQPSLVLNPCIRVDGFYPSQGGGSGSIATLGEITTFATTFTPGGYLPCNGQLLSISQYEALFSLLGTTYGGNGQSTFALPDLRGRITTGTGTGAGLSTRTLGASTGSETTTLNVTNLAPHSHSLPGGGQTSVTGSGTPYNNLQPERAMNYLIATQGIYPSQGGSSGYVGEAPMIGQVVANATGVVPTGFAPCQGQLLSIVQNTALFSILSTTYGGNGTTTFALPDLRGRSPIGPRQGPGLSNYSSGQVGGTETVTMTAAQLPAHTHTLPTGGVSGSTGGGQAQSTLQPTLGLNTIIALTGIFPTNGGGGTTDEPLVGQLTHFAGNFAPSGWAFCDGQILSIAQNTALFSVLGTTYGGNGQTTFALPDLRGRLGMGVGQGPGLSNRSLGEEFGTETITLTEGQLPAHTHTYAVPEPTSLGLVAAGALLFLRRR